MIEDSHSTPAATNDELATLYLRDRDTPCPNCTYNRRDGTSDKCPECGSPISIIAAPEGLQREHFRFAKTMLLFITLFSGFQCGEYVYALWQRLSWGAGLWAPGIRLGSAISLATSILWALLAIFTASRWLQTRQENSTPPSKRVLYPMILVITLFALQDIAWIAHNHFF